MARFCWAPGAMTGINWTGEFPKVDYEVRFGRDAGGRVRLLRRHHVSGDNDSFCSWINGGWGGRVVGLSSLDDMDASENSTTSSRDFQSGRWYGLRFRVTAERIQAWIGEEAGDRREHRESRLSACGPAKSSCSKPLRHHFLFHHRQAAEDRISKLPVGEGLDP